MKAWSFSHYLYLDEQRFLKVFYIRHGKKYEDLHVFINFAVNEKCSFILQISDYATDHIFYYLQYFCFKYLFWAYSFFTNYYQVLLMFCENLLVIKVSITFVTFLHIRNSCSFHFIFNKTIFFRITRVSEQRNGKSFIY